ncbi:hypothetical protein [Citreimonas salinaria]|uniref:Uncharacterized protein n=1 Tax=Citreimonas salinaria TaxID=321339 RepID=A0A1H3FJL9_9RHOB|nr:hypothetical protein [Citreimonas salinaria]SDX91035.1 hypothetical protein SAMN05444340_101477 [Citreimonas salinaria]
MHIPSANDFKERSILPAPLDSETLMLLRAFLRPIVDAAESWNDLACRLAERGYGLGFREGRLVVLNESGLPICTGRCLGMPLRLLARRLGRASISAGRDGRSGVLRQDGNR